MNTVRQYSLVKGLTGLVFYVHDQYLKQMHEHTEVLADNLTKEEAQALFKISNTTQGEIK